MIIMMALTIIIIIVIIIIAAKVALFSALVKFSPDSADQFAHNIEQRGLDGSTPELVKCFGRATNTNPTPSIHPSGAICPPRIALLPNSAFVSASDQFVQPAHHVLRPGSTFWRAGAIQLDALQRVRSLTANRILMMIPRGAL